MTNQSLDERTPVDGTPTVTFYGDVDISFREDGPVLILWNTNGRREEIPFDDDLEDVDEHLRMIANDTTYDMWVDHESDL